LFARSAARLLNPAYHLRSGGKIMKIWRYAEGFVLTNGCDPTRRHLHPRTFRKSLADCVAERNVCVPGTFTLHVANTGEPGVQSQTRVVSTFERAKSLRLCGQR
jgi:hypothetical protein